MNSSNIIIYSEGELEINISVNGETLWLTQKQIAELFEVTVPNINMHLKAIYKEEELFGNRTIQKYLIVQQEGNRKVKREVEHYNLDVVISVGYRVNDTVFTLFSKYQNLKIKIYTQTISKQLRLDYQKYNSQYKNIELKEFKNAHDRFLIIDQKEIYHIGASLKDLGKKWFAFSKFEMEALDILGRLK